MLHRRHRPSHALTDPPKGISRKLVSTGWIKLLNRPFQAEGSLLNEIKKLKAFALIFLGDTHNKTKISLHHPLLGTLANTNHAAVFGAELFAVGRDRSILGLLHELLDLVAKLNFFSSGQ